jgi:prephenate dehydrogenase
LEWNVTKPTITIVGLGLIGTSLGMALRQAEIASAVVGHDKEMAVANQARKREAVDKVEWNLVSACEGADLVILATPLGAIEPTLKAVGPYLRPGCVLIDTATLKVPVLAWAAAILPDTVHFVGGDPIIAGAAAGAEAPAAGVARADLFKDAPFCLTPSPAADPAAVKLAADLVTILGAKPFFLDAAEHDSLLAAVDHLPGITALALLEMASGQPSWKELRKVAGAPFELGTHLVSADPAVYSDLAVANRDNLVRWIDSLSASLASIRHTLTGGDPAALAERFEKAVAERDRWLNDRALGQLLEVPTSARMPGKAEIFDAFLGSALRKGLTGEGSKPGKRGKGH